MTLKIYSNSDTTQISAHFNAREFRCKCGGNHSCQIAAELVDKLEQLYAALDCGKIIVNSGYRCAAHDKAVGGNGAGQHTKGTAADVVCYDKSGGIISTKTVCCKAQDLGFGGIANITSAYTSVHLDVRTGAKWYGDETKGTSTVTSDFYRYFGIAKDSKDSQKAAAKGIDVSKHQGVIDWEKVKASGQVDFAVIRVGIGSDIAEQDDAQFENNYAGCKSNGVPVGVYWYSYATTPAEAKQEAAVCLSVIKGKTFEYPVYFDIEEPSVLAKGKAVCTAIAKAFLETVEKAGYFVGIYSSKSHLESCFTEELRTRYAVWVAHYGVDKTTYRGQYGIWQKSSTGKVSGIRGNVDMNECYVDYPAAIKKKGLNGFKAASAKPAQVAPAKKWVKGQAVKIRSNTPLFANETATTPSARLSAGTYYIYDGVPCKLGRYRITTTAASCGKKPAGKYVTGYVSWDNFREV